MADRTTGPTPRDPYLTIAASVRHEIERVKNSRFIGDARPVTSEDEARAAIEDIRAEMPDASHHCYAYTLRTPDHFKFSDDGEPGGSAGRPILARIQGLELFDVVVVVTRYFGGTKLGVGGLVRAYGEAAAKALTAAEIATITPKRSLGFAYAYDDTTMVEGALRTLEVEPVSTEYTDRVTSVLEVPDHDWTRVRETLLDLTAGRVTFQQDDEA